MNQKTKRIVGILVGISLCLALGTISGFVTKEAIPTWYASLNKPFFTPPNWLFAPVWTLLYMMMGIAVGWVWSFGSHHRWVKTALYHFLAQFILNGLWSMVFFGLKKPLIALLVILSLLILIQRTIHWFLIIHKPSGYLLYPYFAWVSFATLLNIGIIYYN